MEPKMQYGGLSKAAVSLVRRLLRDEAPGIHGRCPPESVAWECTCIGLQVQVEYPDGDSYKEMTKLFPDKFRRRARELGFSEAAEVKEGE